MTSGHLGNYTSLTDVTGTGGKQKNNAKENSRPEHVLVLFLNLDQQTHRHHFCKPLMLPGLIASFLTCLSSRSALRVPVRPLRPPL